LELLYIPSGINYVTDSKNQEVLRTSLEKEMEAKALKLIRKTQEEFQADPFLWSLIVRRKFGSWQEYWDYDWEKKYARAHVNVHVDVKFEGFGKSLAPQMDGGVREEM